MIERKHGTITYHGSVTGRFSSPVKPLDIVTRSELLENYVHAEHLGKILSAAFTEIEKRYLELFRCSDPDEYTRLMGLYDEIEHFPPEISRASNRYLLRGPLKNHEAWKSEIPNPDPTARGISSPSEKTRARLRAKRKKR